MQSVCWWLHKSLKNPHSMTRTIVLKMVWPRHHRVPVTTKTALSGGVEYQVDKWVPTKERPCRARGCTGDHSRPCTTLVPLPPKDRFTAITDLTLALVICDCHTGSLTTVDDLSVYTSGPLPDWLVERCRFLETSRRVTTFKLVVEFAHDDCREMGVNAIESHLLTMIHRLTTLDLLNADSDWAFERKKHECPPRALPVTLQRLALNYGVEDYCRGIDLSRYTSLTYLHIRIALGSCSYLSALPNLATLRLENIAESAAEIHGLTALTELDMSQPVPADIDPADEEAEMTRATLPRMSNLPVIRLLKAWGWRVPMDGPNGWCQMDPKLKQQLKELGRIVFDPGCRERFMPQDDWLLCDRSCCGGHRPPRIEEDSAVYEGDSDDEKEEEEEEDEELVMGRPASFYR